MRWITASVKGIKPRRIPNQDRLLTRLTDYSFLAVIADGLGSAKHSRLGATLACEAVVQAMHLQVSEISACASEIPVKWAEMVVEYGKKPSDCMTTCSFVMVQPEQRHITIGVLGDSSVYVRTDGIMKVGEEHSSDFLNETECLGSSSDQHLRLRSFTYVDTFDILLITDGISADLDCSKIAGLLDFLKGTFGTTSNKSLGLLKTNIKETFGLLNNDDKSMIFAWNEK
jgi:serine/threonine protein phosphatase PrpC